MKILVAIDSSPNADGVLDALARRGWIAGTELRIVTVIETTGHWDTDNQHLTQSLLILNERAERLVVRTGNRLKIVSEVLEGDAATQIVRTATDWKADLIVIGSHGDTGVRKTGIGSVAAAIVNEAPCSVEVVKLKKNHYRKSEPAVCMQAKG